MKIAFLLLHDFAFADWSLNQFLKRYHFSKEYAKRVSKQGHDVVLYVLHQDLKSVTTFNMQSFTIKVFPVEFNFPPYVQFGNSHNLRVLKELKLDKPDIIHYHNYYIWSFPYISAWSRYNRIKIIAQYHGESDILKPIRKLFIPLFNSVNMFLVALDEEIFYLKNNFRINDEKIFKFPNVGVDTELFKPVSSKSGEPMLLYVGRMNAHSRNFKEKSPWILIDIMYELTKKRRDVKLVMVGDGPGLNYLKAMVNKRGLNENVIFMNYIENNKLPALYSKSWLTFIPMQLNTIDPFWDGSLKESLSCMTPVIGFNNYIQSFIDSRRGLGYLVPFDSKKAANIIDRILQDKGEIEEMGTRGRSFVLRHCSWNTVIERLLFLYKSLFEGS
ncbi:MAG: glycosyltransferase family 4 protein [Candidatus Methanomethylicia archaeon]